MKYATLVRLRSISLALGLALLGIVQLHAQTATPPCEAHFRMFRFDGLELFDLDTVCLGTEVTFLDQSTSPNGNMVNWNWQFENGPSSNEQNPVFIFPVEDDGGDITIQLTVDDDNNCFPSALEFTLHIIAPPTFEYETTNPLCFGDCNGLASIINIVGSAPFYTATWDDPLGQTGLDVFSLCDGTYNAIVTDNYGCVAAADAGMAAFIGAPEQLVADISNMAPVFTCPGTGNEVQLSVNITGGVEPAAGYGMSWEPQNGLDDPSSGAPVFTPSLENLNQTYTITVTDNKGCQTTDEIDILATPSNVSGTVMVGAAPCDDCEVDLYVYDPLPGWWTLQDTETTNSSGGYNLGDSPAFSTLALMARPNPILFPGAIPTYFVDLGVFSHLWIDAANSPINTDCGLVLDKDINIIEPIALDGSCTITGGVYGSAPGKMQLTDPIPGVDVVVEKVPPGNALTSDTTDSAGQYEFIGLPILLDGEVYEFYVNIPGVPGVFGYQIAVAGPNLTFEHIDFCLNIDSTQIEGCTVFPVGVSQSEQASSISVYPNPTNSQFSIALGNLKGQTARIDVLDVLGKVVWERNMPALPNMLLVGGIANGNYVVRVSTASEVQTTKLIITGE